MSMGQVTWELSGGVRALRTLVDMLCEVATACGLKPKPRASRKYMGVYLNGYDYWVGISLDMPEVLSFETYYRAVDKEASPRIGMGEIFEWRSGRGHGWRLELNLLSEEVHFFARSKASQLQFLESFVRDCLAVVRAIELPESQAGPEPIEDEEG